MPYESFERRVVYFNFIFASSIKDSLQTNYELELLKLMRMF